MTLLSFVNDKINVINLFVVEDCELDVGVENITKMLETVVVIDDVSIDCTSDGSENDSDTSSDNSYYNSEELEVLAQERGRVIDGSLYDYKDLHKSMTFKDIAEARRYINLHSLANGYNLTIKKSQLSEEAKDHLLHFPIQTWCRVFFDTVCKNNKVENNLAESFNSWILEARHKPIIGMLEDIRIKVMTKFVKNEDELMTWNCDWSPTAIEMYNEFLKITNVCELNFNRDDGFEVSEANDRHIANLAAKKCTCRVWDLTGIPCPHSIKALLYKNLDPLKEIHWWYSKEAYILTYHYKLQPVPSQKFWKIEVEQAMEPPELVNLVGRPRMNRKREKDEALKRQTEWVAPRRGRKMTCSNCGIPGHNARGCHKFNQDSEEGTSNTGQVKSKKQKMNQDMGESITKVGQLKRKKGKMDKQCDKGKKQTNERHRALIDEEDVEYPTPTQDYGGLPLDCYLVVATVEDFPLTAPQPTQYCASDEDEDFGLDVEDDMSWKPRDFSEINFLGDGPSVPTDLYAPKRLTWKGNASETGRMLEQLRKEKMDMRSNKEKKQAKERHTTLLIDEEDVEDFPLTAPQPTQDYASDEDEDEDFGLDVEDDIPWKPRDFLELNSRMQQRQKQAQPTGSRRINFLGDGSSVPSDLYAANGLTWKGNASITGRMLEQLRVEKLKTKKGNDKAQQRQVQ
ncbi:hypothetical protein H5410_052003 [Solanum commersonii]|uniref:SWIM-type domain-containing protein n=1 Tax=Solanum commersonii TaxID=4109 RepID=A0A9J5X2R9_SOLCO|nr:hypothetical protein H5410_052003 [Solanum commersonii]